MHTSLVAQRIKHLPAMQATWVRSLGWENPLEKEMATHSSILAWRIPWTEEPGGLQSTGSQRVGHNWAIKHIINSIFNYYVVFRFTKLTLKGKFTCWGTRTQKTVACTNFCTGAEIFHISFFMLGARYFILLQIFISIHQLTSMWLQ